MFNIYKIIRPASMFLHLVVVILLLIIFLFLIIFLIFKNFFISWRLVSKINLFTVVLFLNLHLFFWLFSYLFFFWLQNFFLKLIFFRLFNWSFKSWWLFNRHLLNRFWINIIRVNATHDRVSIWNRSTFTYLDSKTTYNFFILLNIPRFIFIFFIFLINT